MSGSVKTETINSKIRVLFSAQLAKVEGKRCIIITAEDITEQKQTEETLQASAEDLQNLFDSIEDSIFVSDFNSF